MRFWDKSLLVFKSLCENGTQSVRRIAQKTGLSKSSVHRLRQAIARRGGYPESWLWETEDGRRWLTRFVVAMLSTFGLKRGVDMDTMSEFFSRLRLERQVGCSPSALRGVMQALEAALLETAWTWEQTGRADDEVREIIGAVDETFLEKMMLVFLDLSTGYLLLEEVAEDRTYATWPALWMSGLTRRVVTASGFWYFAIWSSGYGWCFPSRTWIPVYPSIPPLAHCTRLRAQALCS